MKIHYCKDYQHMGGQACAPVLSEISNKKEALLCTATGFSPKGLYGHLAEAYTINPQLFEFLRIIKLDEWGGVPMNETATCEHYLKLHLLDRLQIKEDRYISFNAMDKDPLEECGRVRQELKDKGPIDVCILGLGVNGHIGFNEPSDVLFPHCHSASLTPESLQHPMIENLQGKPKFGLTLGMADILQSQKIILLITGSNKDKTVKKFLSKEISTHLPASFLWLHKNVDCFIDTNSIRV